MGAVVLCGTMISSSIPTYQPVVPRSCWLFYFFLQEKVKTDPICIYHNLSENNDTVLLLF